MGAEGVQKYKTKYYNLDVILSVGYRVNSINATQFRIWANKVLKDYLLKGYAINNRVNRLEEKIMAHFKKGMEKWYDLFFTGEFSSHHIKYLINISKVHLKFNVRQDQVDVLYSFSRQWFHQMISQNVEEQYKRKQALLSMHKLMDINKDIITRTYYEEKLKTFNTEYNFRNLIVIIGERFSFLDITIPIAFVS